MEAVERDATGRTSFICNNCGANFTDLEVRFIHISVFKIHQFYYNKM